MMVLSRYRYGVVKTHLIEFDEVLFYQKLTEVLEKYDIIVGDFSGSQLRLKGFYYNERKNVPLDTKCVTIPEYLAEYCVYGCPYYIVEKIVTKQSTEEWTTSKKS
ncbi:MAG: YutD family protein [Turicibacter sp.]|nr:YutD family protein [Turicibacter sp.]